MAVIVLAEGGCLCPLADEAARQWAHFGSSSKSSLVNKLSSPPPFITRTLYHTVLFFS